MWQIISESYERAYADHKKHNTNDSHMIKYTYENNMNVLDVFI